MPLNAFDNSVHDVGLGAGDPEYGFMLVGAYNKQVQQKNLQIVSDYGGGFDLITQQPKKSRWSQDDFSGGAFQWRFDQDPAMFSDGQNFLPQQQSRSIISVPPFVQSLVFDPEAQPDPNGASLTRWPKNIVALQAELWACFGHGILKYTPSSGATAWYDEGIVAGLGGEYTSLRWDNESENFWALIENKSDPSGFDWLHQFNRSGVSPNGAGVEWVVAPTEMEGRRGYGMTIMNGNVVCQIGSRLWTFRPPEGAEIGTDNWTDKGRLPGRWVDACDYNTLTYILTRSTDFQSHLVAFDGTDVFPVCSFPYNFMAKCMAQYAGRLFIGGSGTDLDGLDRYAELHEVTGSSSRLVRTFSDETYRGSGSYSYPKQIRHLLPMEGLLFMAEDWGGKCWAYDVTTDGFFGGPQNRENAVRPIELSVCRERMYMWGDAASPDEDLRGFWRVANDTDDTGADFYPYIDTADFTVEPSMDKRWDEMVILTRYGTPSLSYSDDGGEAWAAAPEAGVTTTVGNLRYTKFDLTSLGATKTMRWRILFTVEAADSTQWVELMAYTVSFSFEESNDKKHAWTFTINGSDGIEGRDGSTVMQETDTLRDQFWAWMDQKTELTFLDFSGDEKVVTIQDLVEQMPLIGPNAPNEPEAFYALTLLES